MKKNLHPNQQATAAVIDDLIGGGFITRSVIQDRPDGLKNANITWTKKGARLVLAHAEALDSLRNLTKQKAQALNSLITISSFRMVALRHKFEGSGQASSGTVHPSES